MCEATRENMVIDDGGQIFNKFIGVLLIQTHGKRLQAEISAERGE